MQMGGKTYKNSNQTDFVVGFDGEFFSVCPFLSFAAS